MTMNVLVRDVNENPVMADRTLSVAENSGMMSVEVRLADLTSDPDEGRAEFTWTIESEVPSLGLFGNIFWKSAHSESGKWAAA